MVGALNRKLLRDIWALKTQVLTIALVVGSGIAAYIGCLSAHSSLVQLRDAYYASARFAHVFTSAKRAPQWLEDSLRTLPGVVDVQTTVAGNVLVTLPGVTESMTGRVIALPKSGQPTINRVVLQAGSWLNEDDAEGVLVGESFAKAHNLRPGSRVTLLINGKFESLVIRGIALSPEFIYVASPGGFSDDTRFGVFWLTRERLEAAFDMKGAFNYAALLLTRNASLDAVIAAVDNLLDPYGSTGAYGREDQLSHRTLSQEINQQRVFAIIFPVVFMGVALFLLNVLISRHIATERSQIAALKALGYSNITIGLHYLKLVALICAIGLLIGIALGIWFGSWMTQLYTRFFHFPVADYHLSPWLLLSAAAITLAAAALATASAIYAVVRLPPAEALRPPSPAIFRQTLMDRIGLGHVYSPETRMIVREMERRPIRAALTSIGAASAIGILIAGTFWTDAFEYLIHAEFGVRERPDIMIALAEPVSVSAMHEFTRLPGVLAAEGSRDVAVELRNGQYRVRASVIGLEPDARLRQVLDSRLRPLELPSGGITLSDLAAQQLHVRPGERIWVEPLEGDRPAQLLPVTMISGDLMGTIGYMQRREAARLVAETDTVTTVRLRLDTHRRAAFFEEVRQIPRVAAVGEKALLLANFRETSERNMLVFTGILSVFAAAIAVGVVYNSARIQLAEHSWELATLRVLGFRRSEVSRMLLGQLAIQLITAIPLGWALGYGLAWITVGLIEQHEFRIPLLILPSTYAYATLIMLAAGIVSAAIVRRRIDKLDLVSVLKTRE